MKYVLLVIFLLLLSACTVNNLNEIRQAMYRLEDKKFRERSARDITTETSLSKDPADSIVENTNPTSF